MTPSATTAALVETLIEEAFREGFHSHATYNDSTVNDPSEEWARVKADYIKQLAAIAQAAPEQPAVVKESLTPQAEQPAPVALNRWRYVWTAAGGYFERHPDGPWAQVSAAPTPGAQPVPQHTDLWVNVRALRDTLDPPEGRSSTPYAYREKQNDDDVRVVLRELTPGAQTPPPKGHP